MLMDGDKISVYRGDLSRAIFIRADISDESPFEAPS